MTRAPACEAPRPGRRWPMRGQLEIPGLFAPPQDVSSKASDREKLERHCIDWLISVHKCGQDVVRYVNRLFNEFDRLEAFERAKVLVNINGSRCDGWNMGDAEYIGAFDHDIDDYHVIWDRGWAISNGAPREIVPKVWSCTYGGTPKFFDRDGNLLFESVYLRDGKLTEEYEDAHRRALAGCAERQADPST